MDRRRSKVLAASRLCLVFAGLLCLTVWAEPPRIAVASNFAVAAKRLAAAFERSDGARVELVFASTGQHFAQIRNGAPFAAFLAADSERPLRLEQAGQVLPGSRFSYAIGTLALWSKQAGLVDAEASILRTAAFAHLAIARPSLAPYGRAAEQTLRSLGLWDSLQDRLVQGQNVGQAYQFVASGNAELGFVSLAQLRQSRDGPAGSHWVVPVGLHEAIEQQAVLLRNEDDARRFLSMLRGDAGRDIIESLGYRLP